MKAWLEPGRAFAITMWVIVSTVGLILLGVAQSVALSIITGALVPFDAGLVTVLTGAWLLIGTTAIVGPNASNVTERITGKGMPPGSQPAPDQGDH